MVIYFFSYIFVVVEEIILVIGNIFRFVCLVMYVINIFFFI